MDCSSLNTNFAMRQFCQFLPVSDHFHLTTVAADIMPTRHVVKLRVRRCKNAIKVEADNCPVKTRTVPLKFPNFNEITLCDHLILHTARGLPETAFKPLVTLETRGFNNARMQFMHRDLERVIINSYPTRNKDLFDVSFKMFLERFGPRMQYVSVPIKRFPDWKMFASLLLKRMCVMRNKSADALQNLNLEFTFVTFSDMTDVLAYNLVSMKRFGYRFSLIFVCHEEVTRADLQWLNSALRDDYTCVPFGSTPHPALIIFYGTNGESLVFEKRENVYRKRRCPMYLWKPSSKKIKLH